MKRVNVAGWLFVVLVTSLVEAWVCVFHDETQHRHAVVVDAPRSHEDKLVEGTLSSEIGVTLEAYLEGLALRNRDRRRGRRFDRQLPDAARCLVGGAVELPRADPGRGAHPARDTVLRAFRHWRRIALSWRTWPPGRYSISIIYPVRGADRMLYDVARASGIGRAGTALPRNAARRPAEHRDRHPGQCRDRPCRVLDCRVPRRAQAASAPTCSGSSRAFQLPELYAAVVLVEPARLRRQRRAARRPARGRSSGSARSDRRSEDVALAASAAPALGVLVFRRRPRRSGSSGREPRDSFLVPTASEVAERAVGGLADAGLPVGGGGRA